MSAESLANNGGIPTGTTTSASSPHPFVSRLAPLSRTLTHTRRPWRELFSLSSLSLPLGYHDAMSRIRRNVCYYRYNYSLTTLVIVFLSLLWHPISMIVFLVVFVLWIFLFFFRDDAIVLLGREIDNRLVLLGLSVVTVLALVFTQVGLNILVALVIGVSLIGLHAAFRRCDDQFLDEEKVTAGAGDGLVSFGGAAQPMRSYGRAI